MINPIDFENKENLPAEFLEEMSDNKGEDESNKSSGGES